MERSLKDFPEAFSPLVVVVGDRREVRPKTIGDLLAYSVSTVDVLYLEFLGLPPDTLILSDKIFLLEDEHLLCEKFGGRNILTIGSPAANLFSRLINDQSLFRFRIDEEAKRQMFRQEEIVREIAKDQFGLSIYKGVVQGARNLNDIIRLYRGRIEKDDRLEKRFKEIFKKVQGSGLENYRELLRNFEGVGILDPIKEGNLDLRNPKLKGAFLREWNDFGFVSFAVHPFSRAGESVVIYAAGRHGPATSHSIRWLSQKDVWEKRPCGGVFEVQLDTSKSFSEKFQDVTIVWDTDEYSLHEMRDFSLDDLRFRNTEKSSVFISAPLRHNNEKHRENTEWLVQAITNHYEKTGQEIQCTHPYELHDKGKWNYVNGVLQYFPPSRFILHDITDYSPGVVFEVGCSIGLNKRLVLIWNESESDFESKKLPKLLKFTNVRRIDFKNRKSAEAELTKIFESIDSDVEEFLFQCPGMFTRSDRSGCTYHFEWQSMAEDHDKVFLVINNKWRLLKKKTIEFVRDHAYSPVLPKDFADPLMICRICKGIATCSSVIVDVTEQDMDGLVALGMSRARERRSLQLSREGSKRSSMFDGHSQSWRRETLERDLENALNQFFRIL